MCSIGARVKVESEPTDNQSATGNGATNARLRTNGYPRARPGLVALLGTAYEPVDSVHVFTVHRPTEDAFTHLAEVGSDHTVL